MHEDLRRASAQFVSEAAVDGIAIGGTLGRDKEEMRGVLAMTAPLLPPEAPKHLLGIGEVDDLLDGIALGLDLFDCAVPTRLARHGVALAPEPQRRFRLDLRKAGHEGDRRPLAEGCPCPACARHDRDYLSYLSRAEELTAVRLLVLHNLTYLERLMAAAPARDRGGLVRLLPRGDPRRQPRPGPPHRRADVTFGVHWTHEFARRAWWLLGVVLDQLLEVVDDVVHGVAGDLADCTPAALSVGRITTAATAAAIRISAISAITARTKRPKAERSRRGGGAAAGRGGAGGAARGRGGLGRYSVAAVRSSGRVAVSPPRWRVGVSSSASGRVTSSPARPRSRPSASSSALE